MRTKLQFLVTVAVFTIALFLQGISSSVASGIPQSKENTVSKDSIPAGKRLPQQKARPSRISPGEEEYYFIDIKEKRISDNFLTRHLIAKYGEKNLRKVLIDKGKNVFSEPFVSYYILAIEKAFRFPFIFFFVAIIFVMISNVFIVILILFVTNLTMNIRSKNKKKQRAIFEHILTDLLVEAIDQKEAILQLSKFKRKKDLLIEVLIEFQKNFRGDSDRQIIEIYQAMNLGKSSYDKTFAISFFEQVKGLRELTNMLPNQATEMIAARLNDTNDFVRSEAQICYPQVNKDFPFDFLSILDKPFSKWAQLNIYYYIKIHELPVPSFDKWITSSQPHVVSFCIQMISLFQQHENSAAIISLLQNPYEIIRFDAIRTCGELHIIDSKQLLKEIYKTETQKNKLEITRSFLQIGEESDIPFLEEIVRNEELSLRMEACRTIYNLSENSRNYLESLNQSMNFVLTSIIAHIKDPRN